MLFSYGRSNPFANSLSVSQQVLDLSNDLKLQDLLQQQSKIVRTIMKPFSCSDGTDFGVICDVVDITRKIYDKIKQGVQNNKIASERVGAYHYLFRQILKSNHSPQQLLTRHEFSKLDHMKKNTEKIGWFLEGVSLGQKRVHSSECINCAQQFCESWEVSVSNGQKIIAMEKFQTKKFVLTDEDVKKNEIALAKNLIVLMNEKSKAGAALLIGVSQTRENDIVNGVSKPVIVVAGVSLTMELKVDIKESINKVRRKYIYPTLDKGETFEISFIRVVADPILAEKSEDENCMLFKNHSQKCVIRVFVHLKQSYRSFFFVEEKAKNNTLYRMFKSQTHTAIEGHRIYQEMMKKYRTNGKTRATLAEELPHCYIKCRSLVDNEMDRVIGETIEMKEKTKVDPYRYGTLPYKAHQHHSILIVDYKGVDYFNKFVEAAKNTIGEELLIREVYEKFHKVNHRTVYYLTHRKNFEEVRKVVEALDATRKKLVLMKIKQQIGLIKNDLFIDACDLLVDKFERYFQCELNTMFKEVQNNGAVEYEYYFKFESEGQAIFAFVLLEMGDIRANFVNASRLDGCQPIQKLMELKKQQKQLQKEFQNYAEFDETVKKESNKQQQNAQQQQPKKKKQNYKTQKSQSYYQYSQEETFYYYQQQQQYLANQYSPNVYDGEHYAHHDPHYAYNYNYQQQCEHEQNNLSFVQQQQNPNSGSDPYLPTQQSQNQHNVTK